MSGTDPASRQDFGRAEVLTAPAPAAVNRPAGLASNGQADLLAVGLEESLSRVAALAAAALSTPRASVMFAGTRSLSGMISAPGTGGQQSPFEQLLCADVLGSEENLIIGDTRTRSCMRTNGNPPGPVSMMAWAGVPVHDQDGHVAGVIWVADQVPRQWSVSDVAILEILAQVTSSEVTLRAALARSAGRAALAQTLEESLLPPRVPNIPGLQVAAQYAAGGPGRRSSGISAMCSHPPGGPGEWWSAMCAGRGRRRRRAPGPSPRSLGGRPRSCLGSSKNRD